MAEARRFDQHSARFTGLSRYPRRTNEPLRRTLPIGARVIGEGQTMDIADAFLTTEFSDGPHATPVNMIESQGE